MNTSFMFVFNVEGILKKLQIFRKHHYVIKSRYYNLQKFVTLPMYTQTRGIEHFCMLRKSGLHEQIIASVNVKGISKNGKNFRKIHFSIGTLKLFKIRVFVHVYTNNRYFTVVDA